jgi:hypothetical protein
MFTSARFISWIGVTARWFVAVSTRLRAGMAPGKHGPAARLSANPLLAVVLEKLQHGTETLSPRSSGASRRQAVCHGTV